MQIHGILCPEWVMGCYGIRNLTVSLDKSDSCMEFDILLCVLFVIF